MTVKYNESTQQRPQGGRPLNSELLLIDLPSYRKRLKDESAWKNSDRNAITVYKTNSMTIVLIALHKDAEMSSAEGIVSIHVLDGNLKLKTEKATLELGEDQMTVIHTDASHNILALKESVFVLTVMD